MLRQEPFLAVYLIFKREKKVFLIRRKNTGWSDGLYTLPSGHVDKGEDAIMAAIREAHEEVGVTLKPIDLTLVHVMHRKGNDRERVDFYFKVHAWKEELRNAEPEKCDDAQWFLLHELPNNTIETVKDCLNFYQHYIFYSQYGWTEQEK